LVLGLGGLGSAAAQYLAAAGVGRLVIADRDVVDLSNLQRQILYAQSDVGRAKPDAAADRLRALNREMELELCKEETWRAAVARASRSSPARRSGSKASSRCSTRGAATVPVTLACIRSRATSRRRARRQGCSVRRSA